MNKATESHLRRIIERIEVAAQKILQTRGYCQDVARVRILQELIKEQVSNENTSHTTRPLR